MNTVLEGPDYRIRARRLRDHRRSFQTEHVDAFLARAHGVMRSDPAQARQCARLALYITRSIDDPDARARCLRVLTQAAMLVGRWPEALRAVDDALEVLRPLGSSKERAELQSMRVQILTQLERWPEAREVGQRVLRAFQALDDRRGMIRIRVALADLATQLDRPREALNHFRHVDWLLPDNAPPRLRGAIAANRANALLACNRFRAAERWIGIARDLFESAGCEHTTVQMDYNLASAAVQRGRFQEALRRFDEIEPTFTRLKDELHLANIDLDRAEVHLMLNLPEDARGFADRAAERFAELGLARDRAQAEYFGGRAAALTGELQAAIERYESARQGFEALGMSSRAIGCMVQQAYVWHRLERPEVACQMACEAEDKLDVFSSPLTRASVRMLRANFDLALGMEAAALERAQTVLESTQRIFAPWLHVEAYRVVATANARLGARDDAIGAFRAAVEILERRRLGVPPDEYMTAFCSAGTDLYAQLVRLLLDRGDVSLAFEYAQRAKSRALLDTMAGGGRLATERADDDARIRVVREALNAVYWDLLRAGGGTDRDTADARCEAHEQARRLEKELEGLLRRRSVGREVAPETSPADPMPSAGELQRGLETNTALIEYLQTDEEILAFVVTRDAIEGAATTVDATAVEDCLHRLRFHLAKHERPDVAAEELVLRATRENLARLADWLLVPIEEHLRAEHVIVAGHGVLHQVPFHALPWRDGWLSEHFDVTYAPSASVHARCAARPAPATGAPVVLGVPDENAPHIETEARSVASMLGTEQLFLGADATLASLGEAASTARRLHIATHGMFRRATPLMSALGLSDGWVAQADLEALRFRGDLVVLSTCESGVADVSPGSEILGVARGFLNAGVRALLCSQWRVRDDVTAEFMRAFYATLGASDDLRGALRVAMTTVRERHPHPYFWAPFFLLGASSPAPTAQPTTTEGNLR